MGDYTIASVIKAFELIHIMSENNSQMSVTQIAAALDTSISSVSRFLITLREAGYVNKDPQTNKYYLTDKFLLISNRLLNKNELLEKYVPATQFFADKYSVTVNINSFIDNQVYLLYKNPKFINKNLDFMLGQSVPAYCSSAGKMMLSRLSEKALADYFQNTNFFQYQEKTLYSENALRKELLDIVQKGYAIHDEEYVPGIFSISFPLKNCGRYQGVITLICPSSEKHKIYNPDTLTLIQRKLDSY